LSGIKSKLTALLLLSCSTLLTAHASTTPHWVHYRLLQQNPALPKKVIVLPVNVEVIEVTAGDVQEEVPEWSEKAAGNIYKSVSAAIKKIPGLKQIGIPQLSKNYTKVVNEHLALYKVVVNTASKISWKQKIRHFDYSIGSGLSVLGKMTGADAAILVYGRDHVSTAGRKTKAVLSHIPIINIFTGQTPRLGDSFVHIGIVDLKTGDLLWMNSEYRDDSSDLREPESADDIINAVFTWYPGIKRYRNAYLN